MVSARTLGARRRRWTDPRLVGIGLLTGVGLVGAATAGRDPHVPGAWGACPVLALTGHPCPLCGGLRALAHLARGDLAGAAGDNAYAVVLVAAVVGFALVAAYRRRWPGERVVVGAVALLAGTGMIFGAVRLALTGA